MAELLERSPTATLRMSVTASQIPPLHAAVERGDGELLQEMIRSGADLTATDSPVIEQNLHELFIYFLEYIF